MALVDGDKRCSCGRGCETFGECLRGKKITNVYDARLGTSTRGLLRSYERARNEGIQPDAVSPTEVDAALRKSDASGTAYRGDR